VSQAEVFSFFEENVGRLRELLLDALAAVPADRGCACADGGNGVEPVPPPD
jgi:5'-methylthioadenosine phosphorylase